MSAYLDEIERLRTQIKAKDEWHAINPEYATRMKLQNRFTTGLEIAQYTADIMRRDMANYDADSSKYSLRNQHTTSNRPEVLLNLTYSDLKNPIHYLNSTYSQKPSRVSHESKRNLCSIRQTDRGCKCQPQCFWVNNWLQQIKNNNV